LHDHDDVFDPVEVLARRGRALHACGRGNARGQHDSCERDATDRFHARIKLKLTLLCGRQDYESGVT
jgi:hypothetical protein